MNHKLQIVISVVLLMLSLGCQKAQEQDSSKLQESQKAKQPINVSLQLAGVPRKGGVVQASLHATPLIETEKMKLVIEIQSTSARKLIAEQEYHDKKKSETVSLKADIFLPDENNVEIIASAKVEKDSNIIVASEVLRLDLISGMIFHDSTRVQSKSLEPTIIRLEKKDTGEKEEIKKSEEQNLSSAGFWVKGTFHYLDSPVNSSGYGTSVEKPVRYATVEIRDAELIGSELLGTTNTNATGYFEFWVPNNDDGYLENGRDIFVSFIAKTDAGNVQSNILGGQYQAQISTYSNWPGGTLNIGTLVPVDGTGNGVFNIMDNLVNGYQFVSGITSSPPSVTVVWSSGSTDGTYYSSLFNQIHLLGQSSDPDEFDDDIILHEYGHFIASKYSYDKSSGGDHSWYSRVNEQLAWSEGWAHFFSSAQRNSRYQRDYSPGGVSQVDLETPGTLYADNEGAVAAVLWDIFDGTIDGADNFADGITHIWSIFDDGSSNRFFNSSKACVINDFWNGWFSLSYGSNPQIWAIFNQYGMNYDNTAPSNPTSVTSTSHNISSWSNNRTISLNWAGASDDLSGISGYSWTFDQSPSTLPDLLQDGSGTNTSSPSLSDGTNHYFHIRSKDVAGNWGNATHYGPFYIDGTTPTSGTISINNGSSTTTTLIVTLNNLGAIEAGGSGLTQMRFSNDNSIWSSWESYSSVRSNWDLSSYGGNANSGQKLTYVQYRDSAGNISSSFQDAINYSPIPNNPVPTLTSISPASRTIGNPGFTLTANGSGFVAGSIVRFNGSDRTTAFVSSTQLTASILTSDLTTAGSYPITVFNPAPGGGTSGAQPFTVNPQGNPVPTITSILPSSKTVGDPGFTITINGSEFVSGSIVRFNSNDRTTTFVNSTQLTASIPASDLTVAGSYPITVFNPAPGGGTSTAQPFTVNSQSNPIPAITSILPTNKTVGDPGFTLTVYGSGFVSGSRVRFNGNDRTTTFVSSTQLTALILASDLTVAGSYPITVFNPAPGGGTSGPQSFTVNNLTQANFWQQTIGASGKVVRALAINSNGHIFAGTSDDGVFRSTDNGGNWTQVNSGLIDIHIHSLAINSSGYIFAGTNGSSVFRSTDNGESWTQVNRGIENTVVYALAINSNDHIFAGTNGSNSVYRSTNNGENWYAFVLGVNPVKYVAALAINSSGHVFAGTNGNGIFRSMDNGESWAQINADLTNTTIGSLAINSYGHIFVGSPLWGGVFRSIDNGGSWTPINTGLTDTRIHALTINSMGHIFAGTTDGVFRSIDNGSSWTPVNSGLTETFVYALAPNSGDQIFAGTNGSGIFRSAESTTSCYTFTTVVNPKDSGAITTSLPNCSGNYFFGTSINLTATPNPGYIFSGWSCSAGTLVNALSSTTTFTITGNAVVTATFKKPVLTWAARYNGPANAVDEANALAIDNAGNVYVTGHSQGASGNRDYLTLKYNTAGARQWSARYNSPANNLDEAKDIAVDAAGNVYVAGFSYGADGNLDYFTIKYNNTGKWQWSARYNGPGNGDDKINALSIDSAGNVFVTGHGLGMKGNSDYATIKYNSAGVQQWVALYNAPADSVDEAQKIAVDAAGNVYVTGNSFNANGNHDYLTIKYNSVGVQQWVARYNGPGNGDDIANNLTIDGVGNVYVTGHSFGLKGSQDYATIKYNSLGEWQWVARYNGPANSTDEARGLAVDASGNVYVSGYSSAVLWNHDCFTIKYNNAGVQQWTARYNGPGNGLDFGNALAIDGAGNVYVTGHSLGSSGSQDFITIKYNNAGVRLWIARYNTPANNLDEARDIAVDASGNVYVAGYSLAANGKADYITIKYSASSANAQIAESEGEILDEDEESESENRLEINKKTTVPASFVLSQNYPNPFNPTTTIRFATPSAGKVKLTVYNIHGGLVRTLMDSEVAAGDHEVYFDASNLATGIYFCRVEADAFTATQKMILAK